MRRAHYIGIVLLSTLTVAALAPAADGKRIEVIDPPVSETASSLTPHLTSGPNGLYLSWLEEEEPGHALKVSRFDGEAFAPARTVHLSDHFFANWADFASVLALPSGRLVVHWLEKAAEGTYEYDVWIATSDDDGETWSAPERPHTDGTLSEHGFVAMVARGENGFAAVWLDGREFPNDASPREMTLRFAEHDGSSFTSERLLDARVCECCQTAMAQTPTGLAVLYRDRSAEEIRDISIVRLVDGEWTEPAPLHRDGWHLTGCPVNGPQLDASGSHLAAAWFTGEGGDPRVQVTFSTDGGETFGDPIRIDDGQPVGRVDVEWVGGSAWVSWTEKLDGREGEILLRSVAPDGTLGPALTVARTGSTRASGFPRLATFPEVNAQMFIAWTESYDRKGPARVRVGRIVEDVALLDEPAIPFEGETVDGRSVTLASYAGRVVLVNFWGIWCTSCRDEIPKLVELDERFRDSGLAVLGADYGDDASALPRFIAANEMDYPVLVDDGLADDYDIGVFPTSIVIDRAGRLRYRSEGYSEESFRTLSAVVELLLEES